MRTVLTASSLSGRLAEIRQAAKEADAVGILVSDPADLRWACGFTGSHGLLLVTEESAHFVTDGRYREQAFREVAGVTVHLSGRSLVESVIPLCEGIQGRRVLLHAERTPLQIFLELKRRIPGVEWIPEPHLLDKNRASKNESERASICRAQNLTESVFEEVLSRIRPGISEREVAAEIIYLCLRAGSEAMAFDPVVASGPNGALPHARPTDRTIQRGDPVVIDFGCKVDGYASDMTRMVSVGDPGREALRICTAVIGAMEAAVELVCAGRPAVDVDRVARTVLESAGYAEFFAHSLGHGVGLHVHEWPRLGPTSEDVLPLNAVVTIEPGVYLPGHFGVRIEDMVWVNEGPAELLTRTTRQLTIV